MRPTDALPLVFGFGCAGPGVADPGCPPEDPCMVDFGDVAGASVAVANVFDHPLYEVWTGSADGTPVLWRRVVASADAPADPVTTTLDGAWPAVAWDDARDLYWLCRLVGDEVRCATSTDGDAWADGLAVMSGDPDVRPLRPMALVPGDPTVLYVLGARDGVAGLYLATHDGGDTFAMESGAIAGSAEAPVEAATA